MKMCLCKYVTHFVLVEKCVLGFVSFFSTAYLSKMYFFLFRCSLQVFAKYRMGFAKSKWYCKVGRSLGGLTVNYWYKMFLMYKFGTVCCKFRIRTYEQL